MPSVCFLWSVASAWRVDVNADIKKWISLPDINKRNETDWNRRAMFVHDSVTGEILVGLIGNNNNSYNS